MKKLILHLCADTGSDTKPYQDDANYEVILIGSDIGVENYHPPKGVYGIVANPPCTEFSTARSDGKARNPEEGFKIVKECLRIIEECGESLKFWVIENPARGKLVDFLGPPQLKYQPWEYGSPWTKHTALWGKFNIPLKQYSNWDDVPKIQELYTRPNRGKPSLAFMHAKAHMKHIKEFEPFIEKIISKPSRVSSGVGADMEFRSLCSQKFAQEFYKCNK
jgi:hypothetical protein